MAENRVIVILGCTGTGKGALARTLAARIGAEIVSIDSMKVYRSMDIGTAKPSLADRAAIPHHLIDVADPWEPFSAARFVELADAAVASSHARGRPVVAVGGTILYFKCWYDGLFAGPSAVPEIRQALRALAAARGPQHLHEELARVDPESAQRIHAHDFKRIERALEVYRSTGQPISQLQRQWAGNAPRRPEWRWCLWGLQREREQTNRRINQRVATMLSLGLVEEARRLWSAPRGMSATAAQSVGYAELIEHFQGRISLADAVEQIKIHSRRLAKHQRTWLKRQSGLKWLRGEVEDAAGAELTGMAELIQHMVSANN